MGKKVGLMRQRTDKIWNSKKVYKRKKEKKKSTVSCLGTDRLSALATEGGMQQQQTRGARKKKKDDAPCHLVCQKKPLLLLLFFAIQMSLWVFEPTL